MAGFRNTESYEQKFEKDPGATLIELHSEEQEDDFSCGPTIITDILKTLGEDVDQKSIIEEAHSRIMQLPEYKERMTIAELGTPPNVIEAILHDHNVQYEVKPSVKEKTPEADAQALMFLDQKLQQGKVIICPIQSIPEYQEKRDITENGHYVLVCGKVKMNGRTFYITVDPTFHYYQRLSNEESVYTMHKEGRAAPGTPKTKDVYEPDSVETRDFPYAGEQLATFGIDPKKYGYRFMEDTHFIRSWKDISEFGEEYNLYGIAIEIASKTERRI